VCKTIATIVQLCICAQQLLSRMSMHDYNTLFKMWLVNLKFKPKLIFFSILGAEVHAHKICKNLESVYRYVVLFGSADISMQYVFVCISNTLDVCQIFNMYNFIYLTTYLCMQYVHGCVSGLWAGGGGQYFK